MGHAGSWTRVFQISRRNLNSDSIFKTSETCLGRSSRAGEHVGANRGTTDGVTSGATRFELRSSTLESCVGLREISEKKKTGNPRRVFLSLSLSCATVDARGRQREGALTRESVTVLESDAISLENRTRELSRELALSLSLSLSLSRPQLGARRGVNERGGVGGRLPPTRQYRHARFVFHTRITKVSRVFHSLRRCLGNDRWVCCG